MKDENGNQGKKQKVPGLQEVADTGEYLN